MPSGWMPDVEHDVRMRVVWTRGPTTNHEVHHPFRWFLHRYEEPPGKEAKHDKSHQAKAA